MDKAAYTPPQIAQRYGIKPDKVIAWIKAGELRAINVAERATGRPRYRIALADLLAFEERRTARPPVKPLRHQHKTAGVTQYF